MKQELETLKTLAGIVSKETHPTQYQCIPREMILNSKLDWEVMQAHLYKLQESEFVTIAPTQPISFSITEKGLQKGNALEGRSFTIKQFICL